MHDATEAAWNCAVRVGVRASDVKARRVDVYECTLDHVPA